MKLFLISALAAALHVGAFSTQCQTALNTVAEQDDVCNAKTDKTNDACFCSYVKPETIAAACANESDASWELYYIFQKIKVADGCISSSKATVSLPCLTALDTLEQTQHTCALSPWATSCLCQYPAAAIQTACAKDNSDLWKPVYDVTAVYQSHVCPTFSTQTSSIPII
ncbi:UNVERIFIED_CONTAM: hypothetical protein HDU68_007008, partial [Siphonaria sp. JEL0065]